MSKEFEIQEALKFFDLSTPIEDIDIIKKRYKKLTLKYHPDRWGSNEDFILLSKYKDILLKNFGKLDNKFKHYKQEEKKVSFYINQKAKFSIFDYIKIKYRKLVFKIILAYRFIIYYIKFYIELCIFYFTRFLALILLVIIPFILIWNILWDKISKEYYQEWYISEMRDWYDIWRFYADRFEYIWPYSDDYLKHDLPIYKIDYFDTRLSIIKLEFLKHLSIYLIIFITSYSLWKLINKFYKIRKKYIRTSVFFILFYIFSIFISYFILLIYFYVNY